MTRFSRFVSVVTILVAIVVGAPVIAAADTVSTCGSMLMPAAQLKQFSRGFSSHHSGVDLTAPYGSPIRAAAAGTIIFEGRYYGYGNMIDIRHPDGSVTRYGHMSSFVKGVGVGAQVTLGQEIGHIGTSGMAHGAHLHFEVRINGRPVDPAPYLALANCPTGGAKELEEAQAPELATPAHH